MDYESPARFLGLPLIHIATGQQVDGGYRRGAAKGWIAIGDIAVGVLFGAGGIATGAISVGGLAAGGFALGGFALGLAAVGGVAFGYLAVGGAALGGSGALGGLAVAGEFARGGVALAFHANDLSADEYFNGHPFFRSASLLMQYSMGLVALVFVLPRILRRR
ncbi:hypothetical protein FJ251_03995 [bacterium]|nr:hypothetical protein [bacterium]